MIQKLSIAKIEELNKLFLSVAESLDITETQFNNLKRSYDAVGKYLEDDPAFKGMTEDEIIAKVKADVALSNKGQPSYRKVQSVYVSFKEFEKSSTRKVIRQKVIDTYTKDKVKA